MRPPTIVLSLVVVIAFGLVPSGFGQFAPQRQFPLQSSHPELGYYDRVTGAFTPFQSPAQEEEAPPVTATTGTFVFNFTLTVLSTVPTNAKIGCDARVFLSGDTSGFSAGESGFALAHLVSGNTWACTVKIPYSWPLSSATTDTVGRSYDAGIEEGIQITATNGTATAVVPAQPRNSSQSIAPIKVPTTGTTTTQAISITL